MLHAVDIISRSTRATEMESYQFACSSKVSVLRRESFNHSLEKIEFKFYLSRALQEVEIFHGNLIMLRMCER